MTDTITLTREEVMQAKELVEHNLCRGFLSLKSYALCLDCRLCKRLTEFAKESK